MAAPRPAARRPVTPPRLTRGPLPPPRSLPHTTTSCCQAGVFTMGDAYGEWNDAHPYCAWASRGYPPKPNGSTPPGVAWPESATAWGDSLTPDGQWVCNIWHGRFPTHNTGADGWLATAPVRTYPADGFGLYEVAGNVWVWCADWFSPTYYRHSPTDNPRGPLASAFPADQADKWKLPVCRTATRVTGVSAPRSPSPDTPVRSFRSRHAVATGPRERGIRTSQREEISGHHR
jgi:formylglycine-generating enzyme required for sulfatase activity